MGNTIFIQGKRVCVKPLHSQLEAIQKLEPPKTVKGCRSFAGMVNFLSIFCQDLQKLLKPMYDLTRKGRPFVWQQEQQNAFEEIKSRLQKPPILHLPDGKGRSLNMNVIKLSMVTILNYRYGINIICKYCYIV